MPSTSGLVAQLPRAVDKVPFFLGLKKLRDFLNGKIDKLEESEIVFSSVVLSNKKSPAKKEETSISSEIKPEIKLANDIQKYPAYSYSHQNEQQPLANNYKQGQGHPFYPGNSTQ